MSSRSGYELLLTDKFVDDLQRLAADARRDSGKVFLRQQVLRQIEQLSSGSTDGHHALGYEAGKGDLRDCVVGYVQSDPEQKADYRLVFREIGPGAPGELPRRELLAIKPRHGSNNIYAHVCARLNRHPADRQPGLDRFGDRPADSGGSKASRQAELDTKRAIAHAWTGQQPLVSSRPLTLSAGRPRSYAEASGRPRAGPRTSSGPPRPINARPGPTGWPTRHTQSRA
ncbi:hypothetical protein EV652_101548 [Kribbella steppae]|uniref:Uncharacterized protein n=1 Tax=Kribbella steppae TaxID=2512223 RepID=A0A4R2HVW9_9ACTN|nr:hypothetical protein [Kribbella steppae]TCO35663.1 hypothetical protein EV652_101548 [Kribbella steppae]